MVTLAVKMVMKLSPHSLNFATSKKDEHEKNTDLRLYGINDTDNIK